VAQFWLGLGVFFYFITLALNALRARAYNKCEKKGGGICAK
jgi:hypothetical protein